MGVQLQGEHKPLPDVNAKVSVAPNYLVCRAGGRLCAIPLLHIVEIMRLLPIERFGSAPGFVSGVTLVRGQSVPVVDLGYLLRTEDAAAAPAAERFVCLRLHSRLVVVTVEAVLGARGIDADELHALPPLLEASQHLQALVHLDRELCSVLDAARIFELAPASPPVPSHPVTQSERIG